MNGQETKTEGKGMHPKIPESTRSKNGKSEGRKRTFEHRRGARKAPKQVLSVYPEIEPNCIDSYDACDVLVDKRSSGALLTI